MQKTTQTTNHAKRCQLDQKQVDMRYRRKNWSVWTHGDYHLCSDKYLTTHSISGKETTWRPGLGPVWLERFRHCKCQPSVLLLQEGLRKKSEQWQHHQPAQRWKNELSWSFRVDQNIAGTAWRLLGNRPRRQRSIRILPSPESKNLLVQLVIQPQDCLLPQGADPGAALQDPLCEGQPQNANWLVYEQRSHRITHQHGRVRLVIGHGK